MKSTLVWDWPIRVFHWLLVVLFTGLILTGKAEEDYMQYHFYFGYGLSSLVIARVLYGFYGSRYALFSQFVRGPKTVWHFAKSMIIGKPLHYLGHNPLGALMVIALLTTLTVQWASGLFSSDDIFWFGPFNSFVSEDTASLLVSIHHTLPDYLLALVAIHILAVLYHEIRLNERLIEGMIRGIKKQPGIPAQTPRWGIIFSLSMGRCWLAALWLIPI